MVCLLCVCIPGLAFQDQTTQLPPTLQRCSPQGRFELLWEFSPWRWNPTNHRLGDSEEPLFVCPHSPSSQPVLKEVWSAAVEWPLPRPPCCISTGGHRAFLISQVTTSSTLVEVEGSFQASHSEVFSKLLGKQMVLFSFLFFQPRILEITQSKSLAT